jgi:hypothetical protein
MFFKLVILSSTKSLVLKNTGFWPGMVDTCNPSTQEATVGRLGVQGQPGLQSRILPQTKKQTVMPFNDENTRARSNDK